MKKAMKINARYVSAAILSIMLFTVLCGLAAGAVKSADATDAKQITAYGTVDRSTAAQGYITFTASGQDRILALWNPSGRLTAFAVSDGETAKIPLEDSQGRYQYAICNDSGSGGSVCRVDYKDSFVVDEIGTSFVP